MKTKGADGPPLSLGRGPAAAELQSLLEVMPRIASRPWNTL